MRRFVAALVLVLGLSACGGEETLARTVERTPVVVVMEPIMAGTPVGEAVDNGALEVRLAERQFVPDGAAVRFLDIEGVSLRDLPKDTMVLVEMFG